MLKSYSGHSGHTTGAHAKAKAAYKDDPDIPILKQAKAEYAKLQ